MTQLQPEKYEIVGETNEPVITDGQFYLTLKERIAAKFSSQASSRERIQNLESNALEIFTKIRALSRSNDPDRNLLLVGKVQSGKTSNMEMAVALAFDNGFDLLVLFGGFDNTLVDQAITRFGEEGFKKPDSMSEEEARCHWASVFTTREGKGYSIDALDEQAIAKIKSGGGKIIIICRKGPDSIGKINKLFENVNAAGIKSLIFDDEGDQASLNNEFRKHNQSPTYHEILLLKKMLNYPPYLSVTATPQALVFSPDTSHLKPKMLQLIHPGSGYTGLDDFHLGKERTVMVDDEIDSAIECDNPSLPQSLKDALNCYLISSAILRYRHILDKTQMIVHFDKLTKKHEKVYELIHYRLASFQNAIKNNQDDLINKKLEKFRDIFDNDDIIDPSIKNGISFDSIKGDLKFVIGQAYPALMNSQGKDTMAKLAWRDYQIRVGADLLQRGVSFDQLITTYFTRWPKGPSNMDTQIQRARWLGYRTKYFDYCRVFTTDEIAFSFNRLAEIEDDLWDQMSEVEAGTQTLDGIMVQADPKMRPSRRSASSYDIQTFGRKWLNQSIGTTDSSITKINNSALKTLITKYTFKPTNKGSTVMNPNRITARYCTISFEDFKNFICDTEGIFDSHPFGSKTKILKLASSKKIDLMIFGTQQVLTSTLWSLRRTQGLVALGK